MSSTYPVDTLVDLTVADASGLLFSKGIYLAYDTAAPTVSLNSNASAPDTAAIGPYRRATFTVHGLAQDANGISSMDISLDNGDSWTTIAGFTANPGENKAWSCQISG